jgi:predicted Holliday junction resolvase-like endonuclease
MGYYDNILNLLSLVLVLAILFIVLYGCQFKKYRRIERFTDKKFKREELIEDDENETEESSSVKKTKDNENNENKEDENKEDENKEEKDKKKDVLEGFEGEILNGLTTGTLTSKDMDKFINAGTFTRENLENIISYVEKFKNKFS